MRSELPYAIGTSELAARVAARVGKGDWLVVLARANSVPAIAEELSSELETLQESAVRLVSEPGSAEAMRDALSSADGILVVPVGLAFNSDEWAHLDLLRSQMESVGPVILVVPVEHADLVANSAPNIMSWAAGGIWRVDEAFEELTPEERDARLVQLRSSLGYSDEDVVKLAEAHRLPRDPEFAEWLVLLDRGDLIGAGR